MAAVGHNHARVVGFLVLVGSLIVLAAAAEMMTLKKEDAVVGRDGNSARNAAIDGTTRAIGGGVDRRGPGAAGDLVLVYLREQCYDEDLDVSALERDLKVYVDRQLKWEEHVDVKFLNKSGVCNETATAASTLVHALAGTRTRALLGSPAAAHCDTAEQLARVWRKQLITWTCPHQGWHDETTTTRDRERQQWDAGVVQHLVPSVSETAASLASTLRTLRWRSLAIVTSDEGWWPRLAHGLDLSLRSYGVVAKAFITVPQEASNHERVVKLLPLNTFPCRAIIICTSLHPLGQSILSTIDNMRIVQHFGTFVIIVDVISISPYLPHPSHTVVSNFSTNSVSSSTYPLSTHSNSINNLNDSLSSGPVSSKNVQFNSDPHNSKSPVPPPSSYPPSASSSSILVSSIDKLARGNGTQSKLSPPVDRMAQFTHEYMELLSPSAQKNVLVYTSTESNRNISDLFTKSTNVSTEYVLTYLKESLSMMHDQQNEIPLKKKQYHFVMLDWYSVYDNLSARDVPIWRPILKIKYNLTNSSSGMEFNGRLYIVSTIGTNFDDWKWKHRPKDDEDVCEDDLSCQGFSGFSLKTTHIIVLILSLVSLALMLVLVAAFIRHHLVKKRLEKGPYKILLTATDFVFPQVADSRRVDEGIEAMLCCWLQQLQEFGGPEVDKPDLLKGSMGSLKGHAQSVKNASSSTGSLARTLIVDPRVRYNGDLVQLKELPSNQGTFELKSKAMDVLVMVHGLRHENLNPLIGCLTEPTRPGLVSEWCARGSLEDVLVMDEIKLDWSFRLSLLTDLVRGMRYLHSSPIKVHGYLTSRNCVIDARWVLKITDYGLPAFYETQNITPPAKSARDLLWTAPELLRHIGLRKRGSQPGDVYSFGIIMQEVVVRGEPFCMLALTPEEIIEKVKRPPPLIRPSVSKGAAPPEAINIMRQCWAEQAEMRPDFNAVHDLFKKLNHGRKVNFVDTMFQMLEKYSNNLEELIRERTEQLDIEKKKTEQLLNRMLPSSVAEKLKLGMPVDPEEFQEVTIYFSDIVGFTTISAYSTPFQVVDLLNDLYTCFDATINAYNVYKVETIGDAYMVVSGLPVRNPDHAGQIATMALDLLHQSGRFKIRHLPHTPLRLRIGLHTGPCCSGVVGLTMPRYCLFGDTVNTASRMESTGSAWRIHMSQATKDKLDELGGYQIEHRGPTEIKGKGLMHTYWLLGKTGFDKTLPVPPSIEESHGMDESLILYGRINENSHSSHSIEANRSEDNSIAECNSSFEVPPAGKTSPCPQNAEPVPTDVYTFISVNPYNTITTTQSQMPYPQCTTSKNIVRVSASVHEEKLSDAQSRTNASDTAKSSNFSSKSATLTEPEIHAYDIKICKTPEYNSQTPIGNALKNIPNDGSISLGTPVSASEVAAALLGASTSSLCSSGFRTRHRRVGVIEEDDLSTPYNHYRCLSPNDAKITSIVPERNANRMLKRQFSLDRGDDPANNPESATRAQRRLSKQNSAGAAHDLERIEEIPTAGTVGSPCGHYRYKSELTPFHSSLSVSVDSLTLH